MYILPVVRNLISTNVTAAYGAKPQNSSLGELLLIDSLRKKSIMRLTIHKLLSCPYPSSLMVLVSKLLLLPLLLCCATVPPEAMTLYLRT